jgi:hypothetical protein
MTTKKRASKSKPVTSHELALVNYDPTLQTWDAKIKGKSYTLCFDLRFLARAERELRAAGHDVNLFQALPGQTLENIFTMFACSLRRFHPELDYDTACGLLTPAYVYVVNDAINKLWMESIPAPDAEAAKENPTQPGN